MVITTSPLVRTYRLQEFWDLTEPADHSKLELIKGVLYMTPPPENLHSIAVHRLIDNLRDAVREHGYQGHIYVPQAAVWVDDDTYLIPVMFISDELQQAMPPSHWTKVDLVIAIASPATELYDRTTKADTYQAMGVREMWRVYPKTMTVDVRYFASGSAAHFAAEDILRSEVLPGIDLPIARIFT